MFYVVLLPVNNVHRRREVNKVPDKLDLGKGRVYSQCSNITLNFKVALLRPSRAKAATNDCVLFGHCLQ